MRGFAPVCFAQILLLALGANAASAATNRAPTISGTPATTVAADTRYRFRPWAWDRDWDRLTYSISGKPAWAAFSNSSGSLSGTPSASQAGTYSNIVISVTDGQATTSLPAFSIRVTGTGSTTNRAPVISGSPAASVQAGTAYGFQPSASDADGDALTYTVSGKPAWATLSATNGQLSGTPLASQAGTYSNIVISVTDGKATASLPPFTVTVTAATPTNRPPTISGSPSTSVQAGSAYNFRPTVSDADGDALGFSISNKPVWATFSATNGQLSGTPTASQVGAYSNIVISTSDGKATASLPPFTITVTAVTPTNRPPTISGSPSTSVQADTAYNFRPTVSDADGDALGFSISNKPAWATFSIVNAQLSGTPTASQVGAYANIVISTSDGKVTASLPAFTITVTAASGGTNGTATLSWLPPTTNSDGSALTNLAGYKLYHGTSASALSDVRPISSPGTTIFVFDQLATGTHYFAISSVNSVGVEGAMTTVVSKPIP